MKQIDYLHIGDKSTDGKYEIVDEDKQCYKVKMPKGTHAIADKACYKEFVEYAIEHPDQNAQSMKDALNGKTNVDPFTYGYNALFRNLALMTIDPSFVIRKNVSAKSVPRPPTIPISNLKNTHTLQPSRPSHY